MSYGLAILLLFIACLGSLFMSVYNINELSAKRWLGLTVILTYIFGYVVYTAPAMDPICPPNHAYIQSTCIPGVAPLRK